MWIVDDGGAGPGLRFPRFPSELGRGEMLTFAQYHRHQVNKAEHIDDSKREALHQRPADN